MKSEVLKLLGLENAKRVGGLISRMPGTPGQRKAALFYAATGKKSLSARLAGYGLLTARSGALWLNPVVRANIETAQRRLQKTVEVQGGGLEKVAQTLTDAFRAVVVQDGQVMPDHETRLAAAREILRIHGIV